MFPGAISDRESADYAIVGAPLDSSTTFQPGTRFGPGRVRRFAETYDDYDHLTTQHFTDLSVHDAGDVRAWDDACEYLEYLGGTLTDIVREDTVPLLIGGEHTVTAAAAHAVDPDVVVILDAHLDLRDEYDGNPLNHACVTRRMLEGYPEESGLAWGPSTEEVVILGARTGSPEEWERADAADVTVVPPEDVVDWEPSDLTGRSVYLSVDVDGADPGFAPGTGTMEPFGLFPREMRDVVRAVGPDCDGFDIVEVNDRDDGQSAALAGKLLREFVFTHADG